MLGNGKAGFWGFNYLNGATFQSAHQFILTNPIGDFISRIKRQRWVLPQAHGNWARLPFVPIFLPNDVGMFSRGDKQYSRFIIEELHAISPKVDITAIRILHNDDV